MSPNLLVVCEDLNEWNIDYMLGEQLLISVHDATYVPSVGDVLRLFGKSYTVVHIVHEYIGSNGNMKFIAQVVPGVHTSN